MTFPRPDYEALDRYTPNRAPVAVDLSDNTNLWGPHPAADRALREIAENGITRYPSAYADRLRDVVAERFGIATDCVTTGCGSDDVLDSAFRAASEPGGTVAFLHPTFSMIAPLARMNGLRTRTVDWNPWAGPPPDPEALLASDPDLVYLCRPNNPSGTVASRDWVERLLTLSERRGVLVLIDEAYADFADDDWLAAAPERERLLVLRTLSKAYGLAGLRVGFAVGAPSVVLEVDKSRGPYKVSAVADAAAAAALSDASGWTDNVVNEARMMRGVLIEALRQRGFEPAPSEANFVLVPVGSVPAALVDGELRARGVAVRPFGVPGMFNAIRVTVAPWELLEQFLAAFDSACEALRVEPNRPPASAPGPTPSKGSELGDRGGPRR